jgi:hypothetical protein
VKTISIRDLRQRWPHAEALLQVEKELLAWVDRALAESRADRGGSRSRPLLYIDTSALLKFLLPEPESTAVHGAVTAEDLVVVCVLAELEAKVRLRSAWLVSSRPRSGSIVSRLMTHDTLQAEAARGMGYDVLSPGRS